MPKQSRSVTAGRFYDEPVDAGVRILVDRLWPRGIRKDDPRVGRWLPKVAPSNELRKWYGHAPDKFVEFQRRYEQELAGGETAEAFAELQELARKDNVHLVTATREVELSHVAVLAGLLSQT
jgi:uncharacterized protein YeaO (DUF488 family)